jgi:hypothetical protein
VLVGTSSNTDFYLSLPLIVLPISDIDLINVKWFNDGIHTLNRKVSSILLSLQSLLFQMQVTKNRMIWYKSLQSLAAWFDIFRKTQLTLNDSPHFTEWFTAFHRMIQIRHSPHISFNCMPPNVLWWQADWPRCGSWYQTTIYWGTQATYFTISLPSLEHPSSSTNTELTLSCVASQHPNWNKIGAGSSV